MKFASFMHDSQMGWGVVEGDHLREMSAVFPGMPTIRAMLEQNGLSKVLDAIPTAPLLPMIAVKLLPVIPNPSKILCVGLNYLEHREETKNPEVGYPTLFVRFANALSGQGMPIEHPAETTKLDYEAELAVIIGRGGRGISKANAMKHVAGFACANDVSVRDWQRHTSQMTAGKNWPTTGPLGPWMVTRDEIENLAPLSIKCRLNGKTMQDAKLGDMIFDVPHLIEYISTFTELVPGDLIFTGTPGGVGSRREPPVYLKPGDRVEVEIEKIGVLANPVV